MQLAKAIGGTVIQGGILASTDFKIEVNGKMFKLLSDTLYQNKIGSMIREVSCNAYDSHVAAGKFDLPFEIHLPNRLEPFFSVKDFGVGLSHEEVTTIFTCFGKSTKTESNDQVGAFGFGSKTPFAYTEAFTIVSIKDGVKNTYGAIVQENGTPAVNLMSSEETTEGNGVEISVGVEYYDNSTFRDETISQLRYFKVKPIIKGVELTWPDPMAGVIEQHGDNTFFRNSGCTEVVQGGVAYPVDLGQLKKGIGDRPDLKRFIERSVYGYRPVMFFDIGMIAVTPSRESISYDSQTIKNILDRLDFVRVELLKRLDTEMASVTTIWDRTKLLSARAEFFSDLIDIDNNKYGVKSYSGQPYIYMPTGFSDDIETAKGKIDHVLTVYTGNLNHESIFRMKISEDVNKILPTDGVVIVVDDGASLGNSRIRKYIEENERNDTSKKVYFLHGRFAECTRTWTVVDSDGTDAVRKSYGNWVKGDIDPTMFTNFLEAVDGAPIIFLSDLPVPERITIIREKDGTETKVVKPKYVTPKAYQFHSFRYVSGLHYKNFDKTYIAPKKMDERVAYVVIENRNIVDPDFADGDSSTFVMMMSRNVLDMPLYAIRKGDVEKVKDNPLWIPLKDAVATRKKELVEKYKNLHVRYALECSGRKLTSFIHNAYTEFLIKNKDRVADVFLRGYLARKNRYDSKKEKTRADLPVCAHFYGGEIQAIRTRSDKQDERRMAALTKAYPLFSTLTVDHWKVLDEKMMEQLLSVMNHLYTQK